MNRHRSDSRTRPGRQRGIAALSLAMLMLVVSAGLLAGSYFLRSSELQVADVARQHQAMRWAVDAVNAFAAMNGRPPCVARRRGAEEDCAAGGKGWLPLATLEAFGGPLPAASRWLNVRYGVYRGDGTPGDPDLAARADTFVPSLVDGTAMPGYAPVLSGFDQCERLRQMVPATPVTTATGTTFTPRWQMGDRLTGTAGRADRTSIPRPDDAGAVFNVAYAIAVGPAAANASSSGVNADFSRMAFESPSRPNSADYGDMVQVVDANSLFATLRCDSGMASMDTLAVVGASSAKVEALRDGNIDSAINAAQYQPFFSLSSVFGGIAAAIDLNASLELKAEHAVKLAAAELMLLSQVPGVRELGIKQKAEAIAGLAKVAQAMHLNATDIPRAIAGATLDAVYLLAYVVAAEQAKDIKVWQGGDAVLKTADVTGLAND